jgi:hypothetical protein
MITHALQEWAVVCEALGDGRLLLTARKGGIHERGGGLFAPEHRRFALLPTRLHQAADRLLPPFAADLERLQPATLGRLRIDLWAEIDRVWKVEDLYALLALGPDLPWTPEEIHRRFTYREEPWLFVLALRIHRLRQPVEIADDPAYGGCRSWIALKQPIDPMGSVPVVGTGEFGIRCQRFEKHVGRSRGIVPL